jgi:7,8-dihydroneopterin aldolase/epimerase/oxygenase
MGVIHVKGLRCYGYIGCLKEEKIIGREFVVDVALTADLSAAGKTDELRHTIDYCIVYQIVVKEMKKPCNLIEHVCQRIIDALKKEFVQLRQVKVRVTKPNPPVNGDVNHVSVTLQG